MSGRVLRSKKTVATAKAAVSSVAADVQKQGEAVVSGRKRRARADSSAADSSETVRSNKGVAQKKRAVQAEIPEQAAEPEQIPSLLAYEHEAALVHLSTNDAALGALIKLHPPPPDFRERNLPVFHGLCRSIIYQQLAGKAAQTIYLRFVRLFFPSASDSPKEFPTPQAVLDTPTEALRGVGLSERKVSYVKDLAARIVNGDLQADSFDTLSDETIAKQLIAVRGIGPWTVDMFLMFHLNRKDVLAVGDLGVRKGLMRHHGLKQLPTPEQVPKLTEKWRPYRSIGCWLMWRLAETKN